MGSSSARRVCAEKEAERVTDAQESGPQIHLRARADTVASMQMGVEIGRSVHCGQEDDGALQSGKGVCKSWDRCAYVVH